MIVLIIPVLLIIVGVGYGGPIGRMLAAVAIFFLLFIVLACMVV